MTMKRSLLLFVLALLVLVPAGAQDSTPEGTTTTGSVPESINLALQDLSAALNTTLTLSDIDRFQWEGNVYNDASLGCPDSVENYAQVVTEGYQFLIEYNNIVYDYRVAADGSIVFLCQQTDAPAGQIGDATPAPTVTTLPTATQSGVTEDAVCPAVVNIQSGDTLIEIAEACNTTVGAIVDANPSIANRNDLLIIGQDLVIPTVEEGEDVPPVERDIAPLVAVYPTVITSGTQVMLIGNALPPNTDVGIGFGPVASEYSILQESIRTDENGSLYLEVDIPDIANTAGEWVLVIVLPGNQEVVSAALTVE
ncbi:MAG: hypothetical protein OHK0046_13680 [Anaerolineae bacterium]